VNPKTLTVNWLRRFLSRRPPARPAAARARARRRKAAVAVAVGAVVFALLQLGLGIAAELSLWVRDPGYADKEIRLARREAAAGGPVVVMLGTSRTGYGFHAGRIEGRARDELGRPATVFNFGIPASGPVTHLVYARRLIADGHRPDLLLVEVLPPGLADLGPVGPLEARFLFGDRLRHHELGAVTDYGFPAEVRSQWRESVALPWYALRYPLVGRVFPSGLPWQRRFDWSRTTDEHGWSTPMVESVTPAEYKAGLGRSAGEYLAILWDMHPGGGAARALADLLALCRQNGIPVRLVLMPEASDFRAFYSPATAQRLYAFLHRLCAAYGCGLIDARTWLPDAAFTDGHHALRSGAEAFSDRLAREAIVPFLREGRERR
jgi:hypothetical protein